MNVLIIKVSSFQVSLYDITSFVTITKCVDYAGVLILNCPDEQISLLSVFVYL